MNKNDLVKLEQHIGSLQTLYNTWLQENQQPAEVAECGGRTVTQIEELGGAFLDMRVAFLLLLQQTIAYMEGRKQTIATTEQQLKNGMTIEIQ